MTAPALAELRGVAVEVAAPTPTTILGPLDLDVAAGTSLAVVGPSGAGKSTLVSVLGGMLPATRGSYRFAGRPLPTANRGLAAFRARQVGFVFQAAHLLDDRTVLANVELALTVPGHRPTPTAAALDALADAGIGHLAPRAARDLSGGERQRVAIARAVVRRPALLIADEPTGALDRRTGATVLDLLISQTDDGTAVVLVTHDPAVAERTDRTIRLEDGRTT